LAIAYLKVLLWPALEAIRLCIIAIPVAIGFVTIMAIGVWIGWTIATTFPPKPINEISLEVKPQVKVKQKPWQNFETPGLHVLF
jgi:predicted DNA-binding transcriptional regulator